MKTFQWVLLTAVGVLFISQVVSLIQGEKPPTLRKSDMLIECGFLLVLVVYLFIMVLKGT